jgi:polysaccharide biosynthesis/export protein
MFKADHEYLVDSLQRDVKLADKNYVVQENDYLTIQVFTNNGERVIDPDFALSKQQSGATVMRAEPPRILVWRDGYARFPMVGNVYVKGYSLYQVDSLLSLEYTKFYQSAFVMTKLLNKRVVIIGPMGGKVIPLENVNINLIETIALYGGLGDQGKAYKIRLIRGDLKNPNVNIIDLSTIEGMKAANLEVQPNDIIYIETRRKILSESIGEIAPLISLITTLLVSILVITR